MTPFTAARRAVSRLSCASTAAGLAVVVAGAGACAADDPRADERGASAPLPATPAALAAGESLYVASCARCHGIAGAGTTQGPPLAHLVYEPSHHGDESFRLAVRNGVRAHHWRFGDMPPQSNVAPESVEAIVAYVRWVQRQRGIE